MIISLLRKKPKLTIILATTILFLISLPLVLQINYVQNDEWVYFSMIRNFLAGNFRLDPLCAPTFYIQGLLATLFSVVFGIAKLPVLTLLMSVLNFALFTLIIYEFYGKSILKALLVSTLLFFNPLHVYSALGFMTENYFLVPLLASLYFYLKYQKSKVTKHLYMFFLFSFVAFMVKQSALVLPVSALIYSLFTKNRNDVIKILMFLVVTVAFYIFVFPRTPEMTHKGLVFTHFLKSGYTYSLVYGVFIMLTAFSLPLVLSATTKLLKGAEIKRLLVTALLAGMLFFTLNKIFTPMVISWGEFPYFENTFERGGFFPRNLDGTKYLFRYNFDLYRYWDLCAKILLASLIAAGITKTFNAIKYKQSVNKITNNIKFFYFIFIAVYLGLMVVADTFYDRYYYLLLVPFILMLLEDTHHNRVRNFLIAGFAAFLFFIAYQFSMDFVLLNRTVWIKSQQLVEKGFTESKYIKGTKGWRHTYPNGEGIAAPYKYVFAYDPGPPEPFTTLPPIQAERIEIKFPFSIWVNSSVYQLKYR